MQLEPSKIEAIRKLRQFIYANHAQSMFKTSTKQSELARKALKVSKIQELLKIPSLCYTFEEVKQIQSAFMVQSANCNQHIEYRWGWSLGGLFCIMKATVVLGSSATVHICNSSSALMPFSNSLHKGDMGGSYRICIPTAWPAR